MPIASFWGPFLLGVAVTVVAWIITKLLGGGWDLLTKRKQRAREQAAENYERRAPVRVGLQQIAAELRRNAGISARCWEQQAHVPSEARTLTNEEWPSRANEMGVLRDEDRPLWDTIQATYDALIESRRSGGYPPKPEDLRAVAGKCEAHSG